MGCQVVDSVLDVSLQSVPVSHLSGLGGVVEGLRVLDGSLDLVQKTFNLGNSLGVGLGGKSSETHNKRSVSRFKFFRFVEHLLDFLLGILESVGLNE